MTNLLIVLLIALFVLHFTAEVFISNKRLQTLMNNAAGVGIILFFLLAVVGLFLFGA